MESYHEAQIGLKLFDKYYKRQIKYLKYFKHLKYLSNSGCVKEAVSSCHNPSVTDLEDKDQFQETWRRIWKCGGELVNLEENWRRIGKFGNLEENWGI